MSEARSQTILRQRTRPMTLWLVTDVAEVIADEVSGANELRNQPPASRGLRESVLLSYTLDLVVLCPLTDHGSRWKTEDVEVECQGYILFFLVSSSMSSFFTLVPIAHDL